MTDREKFEAWFTTVSAGDIAGWAKQGMWQAWQAALASQQPADDDWIEWTGGECPVDNVEIKRRDGQFRTSGDFGFRWDHRQNDFDIIAYRVVKP